VSLLCAVSAVSTAAISVCAAATRNSHATLEVSEEDIDTAQAIYAQCLERTPRYENASLQQYVAGVGARLRAKHLNEC